jgi:Tol biopolymer transport system component
MKAPNPLALATLVVMLAPPPPASAVRGETLLVSRATGLAGAPGDDASYICRISADGRFVAFESNADNLSAADVDTHLNIYLRDVQAGTTTLISRATGPAGAGADDDSSSPTVSADGRFVAFDSGADDLSPDDDDTVNNIFVRDTMTNTTTLVSRMTGASGAGANGLSRNAAISADGRFVAFESDADNLSPADDDTKTNVFVRDLLTNTTTLVSRATGASGAGSDGNSFVPSISADGRYVAFQSGATNLSPEDNHAVADIFLRDTLMNTTTLVSRATGATGAAGSTFSSSPSVSADGRFVAFESTADNLSPDDNDAVTNIYVRDVVAGTTTLVTRADGPAGAPADGGSGAPTISADGRFVAFQSDADNLSPEDNNAVLNVYVRDVVAGTTTLLSRATGVNGAAGNMSSYTYGFSISGDGRYVTFESDADELSTEDGNAFENVFRRDVRGGPPHCSDITQTVVRQDPSAVVLSCTDDDGDPVTRAIVTGPSHGVASVVDQTAGTVTYTPNPGYTGPDTFTFQASDASGSSPVATATLTVAGCTVAATFSSVECRLDELSAAAAGVPPGRLATKLTKLLGQARTGITAADGLGHTRKARKALGKAAKALGAFGHALGTKAAKKVDPATVASLKSAASSLRQDVSALRG